MPAPTVDDRADVACPAGEVFSIAGGPEFSLGSLALVPYFSRNAGLSEKLLNQYASPYNTFRQVTDITYEVVSVAASLSQVHLLIDTIHIVQLKPYFS